MVAHLQSKVRRIEGLCALEPGDVILDIGSNDGTTLGLYRQGGYRLFGMDPTGAKFHSYYPPHVRLLPTYFAAEKFLAESEGKKAKVVTSFSMFYDLEDPLAFMREIASVLAGDGIWVFEQSYMPAMLATNSYDTVCHEHLEYYSLAQILWMAPRVGLEVIDVELNDVNGGSFSVTAQLTGGPRLTDPSVAQLVAKESDGGLDRLDVYRTFSDRVSESKVKLQAFLQEARHAGNRVVALGASTKGNVILQYCGIGPELISCVGEINRDKFGAFTPGSNITIVDEAEVIAAAPDYVIVLPWHFRRFFDSQQKYKKLRLVYPLPELTGC
jgi:hypothetical protein